MKSRILRLLKENPSAYLSGQVISEKLGVSRTAIWKYINELKGDGYVIDSISRKGYRLLHTPDKLYGYDIDKNLNTNVIGRKILYFNTIDSTNIYAKEAGSKGEEEGTVVISEEQTGGKGRLGRSWVSPKDKGIWMSIILRPEIDPLDASKITQIGAAAVWKALNDIGIDTHIKWPNDIVLNGKKVCGILTEMNSELNRVNYIVIGMGINVNTTEEEFPDVIRNIATSLRIESGKELNRREILVSILNYFEGLYNELIDKGTINSTIEICKQNSALIGRDVRLIYKGQDIKAKALNISAEGELIIEDEKGDVIKIISGEISVRGINGYV